MTLFSILSSQTINCTRIRNKADMGLIFPFWIQYLIFELSHV